MPNDASAKDQASQRAHGDRIRFERQLMRATGMTRQQVRAQLQGATGFVNQVLQRQSTSPPPVQSSESKPITRSEGRFESKTIESGGKKNDDGSPGNQVLCLVIPVETGVLTFMNVTGVLGEAV